MRPSHWAAVLTVGLTLGLTSSCATIITGTSQSVTFTATEPGTHVEVEIGRGSKAATRYEGSTPMTVALSKRKKIFVTYQFADGTKKEAIVPAAGFNWWFAANIIFGGIPGWAIDGITGNVRYWPDQMHFDSRTQRIIADPVFEGGIYYDPDSEELSAKRREEKKRDDSNKWTTFND